MGTHINTGPSSGERSCTAHSLCHAIVSIVLVTGLVATLAAPVESAETYTSANATYQRQFDNQSQSCAYDTARTDAVYFAGREIVFFTQDSYCIVTRSLYWFLPGYTPDLHPNDTVMGYVTLYDWQIANGEPWFKTVVFGNVLYIFYTFGKTGGVPGNTIYYRTVTVSYGDAGTDWKLTFSGQKSIPAGISYAKIRSAVVMNGRLYILYSDYDSAGDGSHWYCMSSADGVTFEAGALFFTSPLYAPLGWWSDATVLMMPDSGGGFSEEVMIAYSSGGSTIYYFFFDGQIAFGHWYVNTALSDVRSVRLFAGTAQGYTNNKYVVQVFAATPTSSGSSWHYMNHGEYTPSGVTGEMGQWKPEWTRLAASSSDGVYQKHEPNWAIIPYFTTEGVNQRMNLRIWYSRHSEYHYKAFGNGYSTLEFRSSTYVSDLLVHSSDPTLQGDPGMSAYPIVGVIQGTPPYPINNDEVPTTDSANTSTVVIETSQSVSFQTTWTVTAGTAVSYKSKFGPVEAQAKLSAGVKHSKESTKGTAIHQSDTLRSYNYMSRRGGLAWVLYLRPEFLIDQYILKSYDGTSLAYDGDASELRISLITYGSNTSLGKKAYYIDDPSAPMGGNDTSTQIFAGMAPMPLTSDFEAWKAPVASTESYKVFKQLPSFQSTQGDQSSTKYVETETNAITNGWNAGFSASATAFGFTAEGNVNYSMDFKTTTSMTQSLGFGYAVPPCGPQGSTTLCISDATVYPYILVPNDDPTGYNAPWISDDIRYFQKAKPWAITYWVTNPPRNATITAVPVAIVRGTVFFDANKPERNRLSARIRLDIPSDFSMVGNEWVHLRFGNYFTDSNELEVISREFDGKDLVLKLRGPNPDSSITARISYNRNTSLVDIDWDADGIDLTPLYSYGVVRGENPTDGAIDFGLYLGEYAARGQLDVHCTSNNRNAVCNVHSK
jgi:hypothetical protein